MLYILHSQQLLRGGNLPICVFLVAARQAFHCGRNAELRWPREEQTFVLLIIIIILPET